MAIIQADSPFPLFTDKGGDPLDGGFVYFGEPDLNPEESPKTVYYDAALAIATPQPLRTSNGYITRNGAPAAIYSDGAFSMTVRDRNGALVFYSPSTFLPIPDGVVLSVDNPKDVSALLADTSLTYATGQTGTVADGDVIRTLAEGFSYEVAASDATDHHVTTAGGVKLYVLPGQGYALTIEEIAATYPISEISISLISGEPRATGLFGRFGTFRWRLGDFTREVGLDTQHPTFRNGIFIESTIPGFDKSVGCWVRDFDGPVNVAWYGARLDRVTDDTEAFNAALYSDADFLPGGVSAANNDLLMRRSVYVPSGDAYLAGTVYIRKGQTLFADGGGSTRIISPVNTRATPTIKMGFGRFGDPAILGGQDPGGLPPAILGFATEGGPINAALIDCTGQDGGGIAGATICDMFITTAPLGVRGAGGDVSVSRVTFDNGGIGMLLEGSRNSITACHFFFNDIGVRVDGPLADWIVDGNTFAFNKVQDIGLRTSNVGAAAWSSSTDYAIGDKALDGTIVYQCVIAATAPNSGTFADYRDANPGKWIRVALRGLKIANNTFTDNNQALTTRSAAIDFEASLQEAQVDIVGNTFANMKERSIRGASQGDLTVIVKDNKHIGLKPNQRYTQSTTSRGILIGGGYWEVSNNTYNGLRAQPVEVNSTRANSRIIIDNETWEECSSGGKFLLLTNLAATSTLEIDNCKGDNVMALMDASNNVGVRIGKNNKQWLGSPLTSGSRQYYVIPTFMVDMRTITVSANSEPGLNSNWRRACMYAVERGVGSPSGSQTDFVSKTDVHISSVAAGTPDALDVDIEIGGVGAGQVISPSAHQIGRGVYVSVPSAYSNFEVSA